MKNGSISDQLNMQERQIKETTQIQNIPQNTLPSEKENTQSVNIENKFSNKQDNNLSNIQPVNQENKKENSQSDLGLSSVLGILTPEQGNDNEEQPIKRPKKKKIPKRGQRR